MTKQVYIAGTAYRDQTKKCFAAQGEAFEITEDFNKADIYVFTGGEDINPRIYGQRPLKNTHFSLDRDSKEVGAYNRIEKGKFKVGICRGAQLLNALNGGSMWQDVNNHQGGHHPVFLNVKGLYKDDTTVTNSIHHQMMIPSPLAITLAYARESNYRVNAQREIIGTTFLDSEVLWIPTDKSFCFQAHPEFGHAGTTELFFKLLKHVEAF